MSIKISLGAQKSAYLNGSYKLEKVYGSYELITHCEMCEKEMPMIYRISKSLICYGIKVPGEFHHDGKRELHLYCRNCHKSIHDWGVIQRWLMKIDKTVDDLPDASKTNAMYKTGWWGYD